MKNSTLTGADVAEGFVLSEEFKSRQVDDTEFIAILYRAFFDREPDYFGAGWVAQLVEGAARESILAGFIAAPEFINLCDQYKIQPY